MAFSIGALGTSRGIRRAPACVAELTQGVADRGITLYVQNESPGAEKEANRLPAPKGPFFVARRLYWPKPDAM